MGSAVGHQALHDPFDGLLDDAAFVGVSLNHGLHEVLRLLHCDVRRQRDRVRIAQGLNHDRAIALQRLRPCVGDVNSTGSMQAAPVAQHS